MKKLLLALLLLLIASHAATASDDRFTVITVDPAAKDLRLFWADEQGQAFRRFDRLSAWLENKGEKLVFAMNAGMYHADAQPVGLLVMDGKEVSPLNLADGKGNFFLKPNGVFVLSRSGPQVVEASEYPALAEPPLLATQSGPLLLRRGVIHPVFNPQSASRYIRNGVGVRGKTVVFVISERPVTFYEFAVFFRDVLQCQDALYLDGAISSLHSVALKRSDRRTELGPLFAVVQSSR